MKVGDIITITGIVAVDKDSAPAARTVIVEGHRRGQVALRSRLLVGGPYPCRDLFDVTLHASDDVVACPVDPPPAIPPW